MESSLIRTDQRNLVSYTKKKECILPLLLLLLLWFLMRLIFYFLHVCFIVIAAVVESCTYAPRNDLLCVEWDGRV